MPNVQRFCSGSLRATRSPSGPHTQLNLAIRVTAATPEAAAAVAGIRLGWEQLLGKLARAVS
ncbi:MAG: hypothetical protein ACRDRJ_51810 [Streptosporangiaceae bacterium]